MLDTAIGWRTMARNRAIVQFQQAWAQAPAAGREALIEATQRDGIGHRWETGERACVLALLVRPALRPGELAKAGAYRMFGCEVTDEFPATWDGAGVTPAQLLAAVGVQVPVVRRPSLAQRLSRLLPRRQSAHAD
ncbi:MAG: hypothetical protein AB7R89_27315 [Dehalococcoidia bacterium]